MTLKDYLKDRSMEDFAKLLGVNYSTVHRWVASEMRPSKVNIDKIKEATKGKVKGRDFYE